MEYLVGILHHMDGHALGNFHLFLLQCCSRVGHEPLLEGLVGPAFGDELLVLFGLVVHGCFPVECRVTKTGARSKTENYHRWETEGNTRRLRRTVWCWYRGLHGDLRGRVSRKGRFNASRLNGLRPLGWFWIAAVREG
jgi:hypothetical protein